MAKAFPKILFDPIYIYGPETCGKSHLTEAAMGYIRRRNPHIHISYLSPEKNLADFATAREYTDTDVLVVDKIEDMGRDITCLSEILARRYQASAQTVMMSRVSPEEAEAWQSAKRWKQTPVVLKIDAQRMAADGFRVGVSENGIYLHDDLHHCNRSWGHYL